MKTLIVCEKCEKTMKLAGTKMSHVQGSDPVVTLRVMPHACNPIQKTCTLSEALDELENTMVEVAYYKKNGDFRELTGFFVFPESGKVGYVLFMEAVTPKMVKKTYHPKNLIRRGISSITRLDDQFMFIV